MEIRDAAERPTMHRTAAYNQELSHSKYPECSGWETLRAFLLLPWTRFYWSCRCLVLCCAKSLQSCPTLCDPPGSSIHGIFQARILKWDTISSSRVSSWPRDRTPSLVSPALAGEFFTTNTTRVAWFKKERKNQHKPRVSTKLGRRGGLLILSWLLQSWRYLNLRHTKCDFLSLQGQADNANLTCFPLW